MTEVTSASLISFINHVCNGKTSNKVIFKKSNFINLLQSGYHGRRLSCR